MNPHELMKHTARLLDKHDLRYFVTGSMAAMAYSRPRLTYDVDIVLSAGPRDVGEIVAAFSTPDFYIDESTVRRAVESFDQFNVIYLPTSLKLDFMVVDEDRYEASRFTRRREISFEGVRIWVAAPEDVMLKKLLYYKEGRSEKHLNDIAAILSASAAHIDYQYTEHWAMRLGVSELWRFVLARAEGREPGPTV